MGGRRDEINYTVAFKGPFLVMVLRYDAHGLFKKKSLKGGPPKKKKNQADKHGRTFNYSKTEQHGSTHFVPELQLELEHDPDLSLRVSVSLSLSLTLTLILTLTLSVSQ